MTDSAERDIVRKKFTLTTHHDELLENIVEQRYASRSEAIRAAIQHHFRYLSEGGETDLEAIKTDVDQLLDELKAVDQKLDERDSTIDVSGLISNEAGENQQTNVGSKTEHLITDELNDSGPSTVDEIVNKTDRDRLEIIPAIQSLEKRGIINPTDSSSSSSEYKLND